MMLTDFALLEGLCHFGSLTDILLSLQELDFQEVSATMRRQHLRMVVHSTTTWRNALITALG